MKKKLISLLILCTAWVLSVNAQRSTMILPPYLQAVTTTSIYVLVESSTTDTVSVEYGLTPSYGRTAKTESIETTTNSTYVHNIKLSGLAPNTAYHYRAVQSGAPSADASFRTAVLPGTSFRCAWMADFRTGKEIHDEIARRVAESNPVMSLYGGDLCVRSTYAAFKDEFFRPNQLALIARVPFFNATGNHEGWSTNTQAFTQAPASASGTQEYYSFDYGDLHVLVLNTQVDYSEDSPQFLFAQSDLASSTKPWKIAIAHKHAYGSGGHDEDSKLITMTTKVLEPLGVDMFIAGHSHFYQHNLVNGIHHLIVGSAGAPLYNPSSAPYTVKSAKDYNYALIDVSPTALKMNVFNDKGTPLDSLSLTKPDNTRKTKQ